MRTTIVTATITTLILCLGDVSAFIPEDNTGPRFERRGIHYDAHAERSLDNYDVYKRSFDGYDLEIIERDAFERGIDFGRDLQHRELSEVLHYELATRDPSSMSVERALTWQDSLTIATTIFALAAGAKNLYLGGLWVLGKIGVVEVSRPPPSWLVKYPCPNRICEQC